MDGMWLFAGNLFYKPESIYFHYELHHTCMLQYRQNCKIYANICSWRDSTSELALNSLSMSVLWQRLIVHRDFLSHLEVNINHSTLSECSFWLISFQWKLSSKKAVVCIPFLGGSEAPWELDKLSTIVLKLT